MIRACSSIDVVFDLDTAPAFPLFVIRRAYIELIVASGIFVIRDTNESELTVTNSPARQRRAPDRNGYEGGRVKGINIPSTSVNGGEIRWNAVMRRCAHENERL